MTSSRPVVAIIGAGFCGTMMAVHLLRATSNTVYDVVLINRPTNASGKSSHSLARGLAYGTNSADHLLNVPAGRMSAFDDAPNDFADFLNASGRSTSTNTFVERRRYGDYLQATLQAAVASAVRRSTGPLLSIRYANVDDINRTFSGQYALQLNEGGAGVTTLHATVVVLALGNFLPSNPPLEDSTIYHCRKYVRDPWASGALEQVDLDQAVLMMGTGLTMYDVAMSLKRRATASGKPLRLLAVSRRGLIPQPHRASVDHTDFTDVPPDIFGSTSVRQDLQSIRRQIRRVEAHGGDWRDVMASLRPIAPARWQQLPDVERQRFLRHLRPYWDSHRHRAAPEAAAQIASMMKVGELIVRAANLVALTDQGDSVSVILRRRGQQDAEQESVGSVINCTGPSSGIDAEPLLWRLAAKGQLTADANGLGLGLLVTDHYRVIESNGAPSNGIFYVGPLLKAQYWEATAVPELRKHVEAAAEAVIQSLAPSDQ
jgi:uncharacterized NAD(P)/FAD-binding protein YdhS